MAPDDLRSGQGNDTPLDVPEKRRGRWSEPSCRRMNMHGSGIDAMTRSETPSQAGEGPADDHLEISKGGDGAPKEKALGGKISGVFARCAHRMAMALGSHHSCMDSMFARHQPR